MMKIFDELNNENFNFFAAQNYHNPGCTDIAEFNEDLSRFKYVKRLLNRYETFGDLKERLILNHIIVIYNVFGIKASNRMVWHKFTYKQWSYIKPFLVFLNYLPENEKVEIKMDPYIVEVLRKI